MPDLLPTILIAIGSAVLLTQRDTRVGLVAFLAQWLGIAWVVWTSTAPGAGTYPASIEIATAIITVIVMALTIFGRRPAPTAKKGKKAQPEARRAPGIVQDWLWLWGLTLLVGVAGYGLARVTSLGVPENSLLAFYWVLLPSMLLIVLEGSRSAVQLGLALLSLSNAASLFLYLTAISAHEAGVIGIAALGRLVLGMLISYLWYMLAARYNSLDFNTLFDRRDGIMPANTNTGLAVRQDDAAAKGAKQGPKDKARHE
jgi:hypothetical protein